MDGGMGPLRIVVLIFGICATAPAFAAASPECVDRAVEILRQDSPIGYRVWSTARSQQTFTSFLECRREDFDESLATAVHETTHMIRGEREAYLLASGEFQKAPTGIGFFAPRKMAGQLAKDLGINAQDDLYFTTYIGRSRTSASSKDELSYLLDELNAYSVDLKVESDLALHGRRSVNPQNHGLSSLMTYVGYYAQYARSFEPETWRLLQQDAEMKSAIQKIWTQAEGVLADACASPRLGGDPNLARNYFSYLCTSSKTSAISQILGRPSQCPSACLSIGHQSTGETDQRMATQRFAQ